MGKFEKKIDNTLGSLFQNFISTLQYSTNGEIDVFISFHFVYGKLKNKDVLTMTRSAEQQSIMYSCCVHHRLEEKKHKISPIPS